jgi:hypothetical protein
MKKRVYTQQQKEEMIEYHINHTIKETIQKYNLKDTHIIAMWVRKLNMPSKRVQNTNSKLKQREKDKTLNKRQKHQIISPELKTEILEYIKTHTLNDASAKYGVAVGTICNWKNPELYKRNCKRTTQWFKDNPDKHKKLIKKHTLKRKQRRESDPHYAEQLRKQVREINKERYDNDSEFKQKMFNVHNTSNKKRRAMRNNVNEDYTKLDEQYTRKLFNHKCAICNSTDNLCIDHWYPLSKGHALSRQNAVLMCKSCNCSKHNKLPHRFYDAKTFNRIQRMLLS